MSLSHNELYKFGEFLLDARANTLARLDGTLVPLKPKVVETLTALVRERGRIVSKDELFALIWPDTVVEEANLTQNIYLLRKTLGAEGFIETLPKRGYRFIAPVTEVNAAPALADTGLVIEEYRATRVVIEEDDEISSAWDLSGNRSALLLPPARAHHRRWAYLALAMGLAAVVTGAVWFVASRWQKAPGFPAGATRVRRITSLPAHEEDADFAPDGQSFAFTSRQGGAGLYKIYLMSINGGAERRLTNSPAEETVPRFSPDGRWIAFDRAEASGNLSIWKVSPFGGPESLLVPQAALPAWSPDGRELAFVRALPDGQRELARRNLTDGNERRVVSFAQHIDTLAWSPDGQTLAFTSDGNLWLVAAAGGAARRLGEKRMQTATWTPDSQALLCGANWSGRTNLWLVPVNGDAPSRLTSGGGVDFYPTLARQGSRLLYTNELWRRSVWAVDENGANPRPLGGKDSYLALAAHPSRRAFIYADYETADGMEQNGLLLGLQDLDNRGQRVLGEGKAPAISPDGTHIACLRPVAQHYELWQLTAETGAARRLTTTPAWEVRPAYSHDGRRVAFHRAGTTPGLTLLELATGQETPLATGQFRAPAFSPDGRWLAASGNSANGLGLYLFDLTTGEGRRLSELSSYEAAPVWSGDSQTLRLLVNEQTQPVLVRLNLAGQEMAPRLALDYPPDPNMLGIFQIEQLPGGGWLYLLTRVEGDIYLMEPGN